MSFHIAGLGTALPEHQMSQSEATELAQQVVCRSEVQARFLEVLYRNAGVDNRYTALPHRMAIEWLEAHAANGSRNYVASGNGNGSDNDHGDVAAGPLSAAGELGPTTAERMEFYQQHAWPLATQAAGQALNQAGLSPTDITHLITVSCTGFSAPGVDVELIRRLALRPTTERVNVGFMGCHGAINGLRVARAIAAADPEARILLCAVELCTLHYRFQWDQERCIGNALFSDGAGAVVGSGTATSGAAAGGATANENWQVTATGSCLLPDSTDAMTWRIGDHGFEMTLSRRVPDLIREHLRPWLVEWLGQNGLGIEDVATWAIHPGGPRILSAVEESLGLDRAATSVSRDVLARHGNMSSPTVLFILDRLRQTAAPRPCVMLGFGPGLMAEAALLKAEG
jgi:predicted naringenin-chalcone synthase